MRVLVLHNHYRHAGGEDVVVASESNLLETHGEEVRVYTVSNETLRTAGARARAAWRAPYSSASRRQIAAEIHWFRPDVVHVHNFFPLLTPSVYDACRAARIPVVQTLHNYRLLCLNAEFFRDGHVCEDCLGKMIPWPGVLHACYRRSRGASAAVAAMLTMSRLRRTWSDKVDVFIALTEFARSKFIQGGLPARKIVIKPNFVRRDPGLGTGGGRYALFVGRLVAVKGLATLLAAGERLQGQIPLKIVGDGPLAGAAGRRAAGVEWLGACSHERVLALMKDAWVLIFPSLYYENFPVVIAEAYAAGLPIIASNVGSMSLLIDDGRTGLHVRPNDPADLAAKLQWLWTRPQDRARMSRNARIEFEQKYTADRNYAALMQIYALATERSSAASSPLTVRMFDG
ncbi:MAG TPA: glycosyltransferase family 4 protein [bacterium]|nr:glycosyltransferase family 4 protein [bacterium]